MACSALAPPPTLFMTEPRVSTQPTPGKWHIKSPGTERGIASHSLSRSPTPNTPFTSLNSETSKAQEYLQGLLATADAGFTPVLRRRPVPLTDGPPNDEYIVCLNIASLHTHLYIDHVYRKIAELAALLAGSDIPKSPLGWVRLQTLQML